MIRATTPTHYFKLPFDCEQYVEKILITYAQNDKKVLEKTENEIAVEKEIICVTLTQEETSLFSADRSCAIQVRVLTKNGDALASKIYYLSVDNVLNDEVL